MFDLDTCIAFITNNAAKKISDEFNDRLSELGITRVQWIALYYLGKHKSISQIELADQMDIKPSTTARLIDRMERDGFVKRERDINDRRTVNLMITDKGREFREKLFPVGEKMSEDVSKGISEEEIEIFKNVLKKMVDNINE
ncbi:MAG: MarR family transcriptional regulator [Clostridiaceae bacterium]|nr:MarR family transcriptional regulator [Clostridiaceae bacterium]